MLTVAMRRRAAAAALQGDPVSVEAAVRAYALAVNLALLAAFACVLQAMPAAAWRRIRRHAGAAAVRMRQGP